MDVNQDKTFAEQVDDVLSGADTNISHLEVLKVTPPLLRMVGVPNLPILMTARHVRTITQDSGNDSANYHGLGVELVKQLPELISDPVMIMDSLTKDDSIVVVTQTVDKQNRPVIGAIRLNGVGRQDSKIISANILTSAYGKDNFQSFIERNIEQGSVLYVDKEKSQALSVNPGIQFPDVMASLDFNTIIRKTNAFVNTPNKNNLDARKKEGKEMSSKEFCIAVDTQSKQFKNLVKAINRTNKNFDDGLGDVVDMFAALKAKKDIDFTPKLFGREFEPMHITAGQELVYIVGESYPASLIYSNFGGFEVGSGLNDKLKGITGAHNRFKKGSAQNDFFQYSEVLGNELVVPFNQQTFEETTKEVEESKDNIDIKAPQQAARERVQQIRDGMVKTLLEHIEKNPTDWQSGWNNIAAGAPYNGKTNTAYRGLNALYLAVLSMQRGYKDTRWVTFNQAKELGASVKKGEKSAPVIFFEFYDRKTKKAFDNRTVKDMTDEEKTAYLKENVYAVMKYSSVFNAEQCHNFPERKEIAMSEEERANQNAKIETIIANSGAPVRYDGGSRAYYSPGTDSIHLPAIAAFDTMQDYYATALHEIAHSTGHESRLNRDLAGGFGSENYAKEELRAELACVFMQMEQGIQLNGKHITNHAAYLNSWLQAAKNDTSVFFKAAADAQKIADYVADNYLQAVDSAVIEEENVEKSEPENKIILYTTVIENNAKGKPCYNAYMLDKDSGELKFLLGDFSSDMALQATVDQDAEYSYKGYTFKRIEPQELYEISEKIKAENNQVQEPPESNPMADYLRAERTNREPGEILSLEDNIKEWYTATYPTDELGKKISPDFSFDDLHEELLRHNTDHIYGMLGVEDSVVRERVFGQLAKITKKPYQVIYDLWQGYDPGDKLANARAQARRLATETGEPYVTIEWTEKMDGFPDIKAYDVMSLSEADKKLATLDKQADLDEGYYKTKLHIDFVFEGKPETYENCRFYIGVEGGGFVHHIDEFLTNDKFLDARERAEAEAALEYFKRHIEVSEYLANPAKLAELTEEEQGDINEYVYRARNVLNNTEPFSDYSNHMPLTPEEIKKSRDAAHAAGLPFSSRPFEGPDDDFDPYVFDGSMSVEDYKRMWELREQDEANSEPLYFKETKNGSPVNGIKEIGTGYYVAIINNYEQKEEVFPEGYPPGYLIAIDYSPHRGEFTTAAYGFETYEEARGYYLENNGIDIGPSPEAELYDAKRAENLGEHKEKINKIPHYAIDFQLNYSNEMLLTNELKKLGYEQDNSLYEVNERSNSLNAAKGAERWLNAIRYIGADGKSFEGFYGRTYNGIMLEATNITGFTTSGLSLDEVNEIAAVVRDFGVDVAVKEVPMPINSNQTEGDHEEKLTVEQARNAMLDAQEQRQRYYAVRIENVPYTDPEDGYESEEPAQVIYTISQTGRIEQYKTISLDSDVFSSDLPNGGLISYEPVEYEELEEIAKKVREPIQTFKDVLRAELEAGTERRRSEAYYDQRVDDILDEHYRTEYGLFERNIDNPKYLSGMLYAEETFRGERVVSLTQDESGKNIAIIARHSGGFTVAEDYSPDDGRRWGKAHYFDDQKSAEEFVTKEFSAKKPSAAEIKALGILIQQKGRDVAEYITIEGSNVLFRSEELAVKYGGKIEDGRIVITPEMEATYNRLQYERLAGSSSELGREYAAVKLKNPDNIVFYRIGDFYEVLGADASRVSDTLNLTLTGRDMGGERIPMAGVPFHTMDEYAQKLAASGENVVIADKENGIKKIDAVKAPNLDNRMGRRINAYAESLKKIDIELGYAARPEEYYRDRAMKEIAAYEQSDEYQQALREDFPNDFIDDSYRDMAQIPQNKPVEAQERKREWLSIELPDGAVGGQYGDNTMIKMSKGEFSYYAFYVPTRFLKEADGKTQLRVASDFSFCLNNDGRQVELTGQELKDSFAGKHLDKTYKRVAPSRRYAQGLANIEKNVPAELKAIPTWCCYRTQWNAEKGKKDKFIISPIDGKWASTKEPGRWVTFEAAMKYARENNCEGLSVLLDKQHGITCIDLDKCIEAETGKLNERASKLVEALSGTYIERSTSGNGLHIFVKDDILKNGQYNMTSTDKNKGDLEVYDDKRIMSLTGDLYSKGNTLTRAGSAATVYLRRELGERRSVSNNGAKPHPTGSLNLSDNELIRWIQSSKQGSKFNDLYNGRGVSGNRSEDDAKLAHMLLYFNGGDKEQAFRIMRESGAYRPDKPDSYYRATIDKMDAKIEVYAKRPTFSADGIGKPKGNGNVRRGSQA